MISASAAAKGARDAEYFALGLAGFCTVIGLAIGVLFFHTRYVHQTQVRVTHPSVSQLLGKPVQSVDGAQVNQALAGLTCDVYAAGQSLKAVYCHR